MLVYWSRLEGGELIQFSFNKMFIFEQFKLLIFSQRYIFLKHSHHLQNFFPSLSVRICLCIVHLWFLLDPLYFLSFFFFFLSSLFSAKFILISLSFIALYGSKYMVGYGVDFYAVNISNIFISLSILSFPCQLAICSSLVQCLLSLHLLVSITVLFYSNGNPLLW